VKLLAIDAATEACSVALMIGEEVTSRHEIAPRGHAQRLLPMVEEVLSEAGVSLSSLDAIAFDRGPGSFTGVRVGTSVTQGLAFGADLPVIPVSSLAAIAQGVWQETGTTAIMAAIDARMKEIYWGLYIIEDGITQIQGIEHISRAEAVTLTKEQQWYGAGSGWLVYEETLLQLAPSGYTGFDGRRLPHAKDILSLAKASFSRQDYVSAEQALPCYLRNEVARKQSGV